MFGVLARTYFRATGSVPGHLGANTKRSWYGDDLSARTAPKRWEDWK